MANMYLFFVIVLAVLAISDLVIGVSNDAVNFLNSAIGARVAKINTIMIIAGLGVLVGATLSGGMMEVARKGIFHPEYFHFYEIMFIFMAVMITDVILLDMFNSFGMPTSTTVSIVFELLGAAVGMAVVKVSTGNIAVGAPLISDYINSSTALKIIGGIFLSVIVAFSVGMIIQFLIRLIFTFDFNKKVKYFGALWGGFALSAIFYFVLIKGAKNAPFMDDEIKTYIANNTWTIIMGSFVFWTVLLQLINMLTKIDIFKIIVLVGTFALAMAFAGNDLVNFIGVPIAGYEAYSLFVQGGGIDTQFLMTGLAAKEKAPILFLGLAGLIMVLTLWTSKKARKVIKTSLDLGRQDDGSERFGSSVMGRSIVRVTASAANNITAILPQRAHNFINKSFDQQPFTEMVSSMPAEEAPSFDMVRASVTLVVASILIAIGTTLKLPLSTTYVTFMVAMGTSLADGAWGRDSAVYRVSGVLSVIGGWFFTALSAFSAAFVVVMIFSYFGTLAIFAFLILVLYLLYKSHIKEKNLRSIQADEFDTYINDPIDAAFIYEKGVRYSNRLFKSVSETLTKSIDALPKQNVKKLQESKREFKIVFDKIKRVNNKVNLTISKLNDQSEDAGIHYIKSMYFLHEVALSNDRIVQPLYRYFANSHKALLIDQLSDLSNAAKLVDMTFDEALVMINNSDYSNLDAFIEQRDIRISTLDQLRKAQVKRIKRKEVGTRNSVLYFDAISEIRHLLIYAGNFLGSYKEFHERVESVEPVNEE